MQFGSFINCFGWIMVIGGFATTMIGGFLNLPYLIKNNEHSIDHMVQHLIAVEEELHEVKEKVGLGLSNNNKSENVIPEIVVNKCE